MAGFVGVNFRIGRDDGADEGNTLGLGLRDGRDRAALALAGDNNNAALSGLMLRLAAIDAVLDMIGGTDVAADVNPEASGSRTWA